MAGLNEQGQVKLEMLFQRAARYQATLIDIAKSNTEFAGQYVSALCNVRSPADLVTVMSDYTKKGSDLLNQHTRDLMELNDETLH